MKSRSNLIEIERLRHLVAEVAHTTFPTGAAIDERHVRIYVSTASTTASDHGVCHKRHGILSARVSLELKGKKVVDLRRQI
jgi:hypothetical protein